MNQYLKLGKFSFGMGDRFGQQGRAQLQACVLATELGAEFIPVWNKSNREHTFIGTEPASLRAEADAAVQALGWVQPYHVDADHIRMETVDRFIAPSDFFTIDVADSIGQPAAPDAVKAFVNRHPELVGSLAIPHIESPFTTTRAEVEAVAAKFLLAVQEAGRIYRHIAAANLNASQSRGMLACFTTSTRPGSVVLTKTLAASTHPIFSSPQYVAAYAASCIA